MKAQEIIDRIQVETSDLAQIKAALEDGEALSALGITDADQGEVEEAHFLVSQELKNQQQPATQGAQKQRRMKMGKIELMDAQTGFIGPVAVGEYVAQWLSADKTESVPLSTYSHDDADDCIAKAKDCAASIDLTVGQIEVMLIVPNNLD